MTDTANTHHKSSLAALTLGALGVVFGDIGTSPLYAFKEAFGDAHGLPLTPANVLAVLSMMFWTVTLIVTMKYVSIVLRFDNRGEGGILALLAFTSRSLRDKPRLAAAASLLAVAGASLFYGDAVITPAISVLSAVEGLSVAAPRLEHWVVPLTIAIIVALFAIQSRGTSSVGKLFGPITVVWFLVLAFLGVRSIMATPEVLGALNPGHALAFVTHHPGMAFFTLGAVFLAVTGAEALYADMGHFGPKPIRLAWFILVFPCLMLNYMGQGALVLRDAAAAKNPFYLMVPQEWALPLVVLATMATVIASQATISGAFSVTQQASRLGYLPRIPVEVTSDVERGQIYIGRVNWLLMILVVALVLSFQSSSALAAAYGIAVSLTMLLETALIVVVVMQLEHRARIVLAAVLVAIGLVELLFVASNATKILDGGWFPLVCGAVLFTLLTTWRSARSIIAAREAAYSVPMAGFMESLNGDSITRVSGTAVYLSSRLDVVPSTLLHNLKHNKVVHERMVFLSLVTDDVPYVPNVERTEVQVLKRGEIYQVTLHYGFREDPDIPLGIGLLKRHGLNIEVDETTFFLGKTAIARASRPGLFTWRRELFRWMQRNTPSSIEYYKLPPGRVIELGTQISI
jgi:KUP system potassium uptake protein